jgi:pimeloyl-ACP methyl ester carboxylesterase
MVKAYRIYFKFLDLLFPSIAAKKVYHIMSNPRIHKLREFEVKALDRSVKERLKFKSFEIQKYSWGSAGNPVALLIHGWEGQAGNFGAMIDLLLDKGYHVIAYDAPSHGGSSKGNTSMFEYADFVTERLKVHKPKVILSHSFGSVTAAFALKENPDVQVSQWYLITTPYHFRDRINEMAEFIGVSERTIKRLISNLEKNINIPLNDLNMEVYGGNLKNLDEAFIIHSSSDRVIPIEKARLSNKAIPQSKLIVLENLGHYRILWSERLLSILKKEIE